MHAPVLHDSTIPLLQSSSLRLTTVPGLLLCALLPVLGLSKDVSAAGERWALLIGIDDYQALGKLKYCAADAEALGRVLVARSGYKPSHVVTLTDQTEEAGDRPTFLNIRRRITLISKLAAEDDTILVFFSGHGVTVDGKGYLVPQDGDTQNALALDWVRSTLEGSKARNRLLILDACHSGSAAKGVSGIVPDLATKGLVMLLSSQKDEVSYPDEKLGHSVFSYHLLMGLAGKAAAQGEFVTGKSLYDYVLSQMKAWTFRTGKVQTPLLVGQGAERLVLAKARKGEEIDLSAFGTATVNLPKGWTSEKRRIKVATPEGEQQKEITYYKNSIGMEFVQVPAGELMMGSPANEEERSDDEGPQHKVKLSKGFSMGAFEVTQEQYEKVMDTNPANFKGDKNPVEQVCWNDAVEFCKRLSQKEGTTYGLPSEAQWEYACRAGSATPFYFGKTISTEQVNYDGNYTYGTGRKGPYREKTTPVGTFPANAFGLHDMHGNVWEWCQDVWHGDYNGAPADGSAWIAGGDQDRRVCRGGSWFSDPWFCPSAFRFRFSPVNRINSLGFRCVLFRDF